MVGVGRFVSDYVEAGLGFLLLCIHVLQLLLEHTLAPLIIKQIHETLLKKMLLALKYDKKSSGLGPPSTWQQQDLRSSVYFLFFLVKIQFWKHVANVENKKNLTCCLSLAKLFT